MFNLELNGVKIMVYTSETLSRYMAVANDPRFEPDDLFLKVSDDLYVRQTMTRGDLYKAMGYQTFDFAYPEPWGETVQAKILFAQWGDRVTMKDPLTGEEKTRPWRPGDPRPSLVWCYDPPDPSRPEKISVFGYPVFDRQVIADLGRVIMARLKAGEVNHVSLSWLEKKENDADLYFEQEIHNDV